MRTLVVACLVLAELARADEIGRHNLCAPFLLEGAYRAKADHAASLFDAGKHLISRRRYRKILDSLEAPWPGISHVFEGPDSVREFLTFVPDSAVDAQDRDQKGKRKSYGNATFFTALALTLWIVCGLQLEPQGKLIGGGGLISGLLARGVRWLYGPSYWEFLEKVRTNSEDPTGPRGAFTYAYDGPAASLDMIYFSDGPTVVVHSRQR